MFNTPKVKKEGTYPGEALHFRDTPVFPQEMPPGPRGTQDWLIRHQCQPFLKAEIFHRQKLNPFKNEYWPASVLQLF